MAENWVVAENWRVYTISQEGVSIPYVITCKNGVNKEEHGDNKGDSSPI